MPRPGEYRFARCRFRGFETGSSYPWFYHRPFRVQCFRQTAPSLRGRAYNVRPSAAPKQNRRSSRQNSLPLPHERFLSSAASPSRFVCARRLFRPCCSCNYIAGLCSVQTALFRIKHCPICCSSGFGCDSNFPASVLLQCPFRVHPCRLRRKPTCGFHLMHCRPTRDDPASAQPICRVVPR